MYHQPPMDWSQIATKRDLDQLADRLRAEFHKGFGAPRGELRREFGELRRELHYEFGRLRAQIRIQTLNLFFRLLIANAVMVGLVLAILKYA